MILLLGSIDDAALALVGSVCFSQGRTSLVLDAVRVDQVQVYLETCHDRVRGSLDFGDESYPLEDFSGVYIRVGSVSRSDDVVRPVDSDPQTLSPLSLLMLWCELAPVRVVTRPSVAGSNFSKPYQAQLIREQGFSVPETLVTNDPDLVMDFYRRCKRVVYKSTSSRRSVTHELDAEGLNRLEGILWCPTQFQQFIEGLNMRVHVIDGRCFGTAIQTDAVDYRYLKGIQSPVDMYPVDLPEELANRCVQLANALELPFAGIDLKITPDGVTYCLEVNTSPAFSYYEDRTGQTISNALVDYLAGAPRQHVGI